jgi:hypothetical protein
VGTRGSACCSLRRRPRVPSLWRSAPRSHRPRGSAGRSR